MDVLPLPSNPTLALFEARAGELVRTWQSNDPDAVRSWASAWLGSIAREQAEAPSEFVLGSMERAVAAFTDYLSRRRGDATLADAQLLIARAHGFASWDAFAGHIQDVGRDSSERSLFERAADAVITGDIETLGALLRDHPELARERSARSHEATLLHYVAANGVEDFRQKSPANAVEIATLLLDSGAEVDAVAGTYGKDNYQTTMNLLVSSVHPASAGVQVPLVHLLLDRGAAVNGLDEDSSPLITSIAFGYRGATEALVQRGARIDQVTTAAALGRLDIVRSLVVDASTLAPGTRMNLVWIKLPQDPRVHIAFAAVWAAMFDQREVLSWLLDIGVSPMAMDNNQVSLLHGAAARGNIAMVERLVAAGADLELENAWGGTVLDSMVYFAYNDPWPGADYVQTARRLLELGADPARVSPVPTGIAGLDELLMGARPQQ